MERLVENRERKRHRSHILEAPLIWASVIWCAVGMIVRDSCRDELLMRISLEAPLETAIIIFGMDNNENHTW